MEVENKKPPRARSSNWTPEMREMLRSTVAPKISIVDSKENSTACIKLKYDAWQCIERDMEASGYKIPAKRLREQWNRIKMQSRSTISQFNRELRATGGGDFPKEPNEFDYSVMSMTPIDFENDDTQFDSDAMIRNVSLPENNKENVPVSGENAAMTDNKNAFPEKCHNSFSSKRRKNATPKIGEEMMRERIKQITAESTQNEKLFNLKLEVEKFRLECIKELHDKDIQIKNKEIELLTLKVESERMFRS